MIVRDFLLLLLDDALEDARLHYLEAPRSFLEFQGAFTGLQECQERMMGDGMAERLSSLLAEARLQSAEALQENAPDKQFWFSREVQVEWISNVVSVILLQQRLPVIVQPTKGAALAAARLVGAAD